MDGFMMTSEEFLDKCSKADLKVFPLKQFIKITSDCLETVISEPLAVNSIDSLNVFCHKKFGSPPSFLFTKINDSHKCIALFESYSSDAVSDNKDEAKENAANDLLLKLQAISKLKIGDNPSQNIDASLLAKVSDLPEVSPKNPISQLCEYCQRKFKSLPDFYYDFNVEKNQFKCVASINGHLANAFSGSKKSARKQASTLLMNVLASGDSPNIGSIIKIKNEDSSSISFACDNDQPKSPAESVSQVTQSSISLNQSVEKSFDDASVTCESTDITMNFSSSSNVSVPKIANCYEFLSNSNLNYISKLCQYCQKTFKKAPVFKYSYNVETCEYNCIVSINSSSANAVSKIKKTAKTEASKNLLNILIGENSEISEIKNHVNQSEELVIENNADTSNEIVEDMIVEVSSTESTLTNAPKSFISILYEHCTKAFKDDPSYSYEKKMGLFFCTASIAQYSEKGSSIKKQQSKELASQKLLKKLLPDKFPN